MNVWYISIELRRAISEIVTYVSVPNLQVLECFNCFLRHRTSIANYYRINLSRLGVQLCCEGVERGFLLLNFAPIPHLRIFIFFMSDCYIQHMNFPFTDHHKIRLQIRPLWCCDKRLFYELATFLRGDLLCQQVPGFVVPFCVNTLAQYMCQCLVICSAFPALDSCLGHYFVHSNSVGCHTTS